MNSKLEFKPGDWVKIVCVPPEEMDDHVYGDINGFKQGLSAAINNNDLLMSQGRAYNGVIFKTECDSPELDALPYAVTCEAYSDDLRAAGIDIDEHNHHWFSRLNVLSLVVTEDKRLRNVGEF